MAKFMVRDQVGGGDPADALLLDWQAGVPITVRQLIAERVRLEYEDVVEQRKAYPEPLVNLPAEPQDPAEGVVARAHAGFRKREFLIVVDHRQLTSLDDVIRLSPTTDITFLRLMPLAGG